MMIWKNSERGELCGARSCGERQSHILVDENDDNEIIASISVLWNNDDTCNVEALCKKIRFNCRFEHLENWRLKTIMHDVKKFVRYEINHLIEENQKPIKKNIYEMIDGIPMWKHFKDGAEKIKIHLIGNDYGKLSEILGKRILKDLFQRREILNEMFAGIEILRVRQIKKFKILEKAKIGLGDIVLEVDYRKDEKFGKKIIIFEIKHGKLIIEQNQLKRYCSMTLKPEEYFSKADELKIIYMMFDNIDTLNATAYYSLQEIDKDFARTVVERTPVENYRFQEDQLYI